jgi:hypothetical protein
VRRHRSEAGRLELIQAAEIDREPVGRQLRNGFRSVAPAGPALGASVRNAFVRGRQLVRFLHKPAILGHIYRARTQKLVQLAVVPANPAWPPRLPNKVGLLRSASR